MSQKFQTVISSIYRKIQIIYSCTIMHLYLYSFTVVTVIYAISRPVYNYVFPDKCKIINIDQILQVFRNDIVFHASFNAFSTLHYIVLSSDYRLHNGMPTRHFTRHYCRPVLFYRYFKGRPLP